MKSVFRAIACVTAMLSTLAIANDVNSSVEQDYDKHLKDLFIHFHQNPELSLVENKTAARLTSELSAAGFTVTENVGVDIQGLPSTGIVAIMENGEGPMVMMRADMDGLPVEEKSGLPYASKATQISTITGKEVPVMHACGHDVHITSLVGTARYMAANKDQWSGTLMLIGQPAEERIMGAKQMMDADLWGTFGKPDYAIAFHVSAGAPVGAINVINGSPYAGSDSGNLVIHGIGAHGASPHTGKDPIVLGSQIVLALQTLVSRELSPRQPGVVTVGSFHSGTKGNIISDKAVLQLTVRNTNLETRKLLLDGIERIAQNLGRAAGLPEDKLPEFEIDQSTPPTVNDDPLVDRLRAVWKQKLGDDSVFAFPPGHMGAEDFPQFTLEPYIPSVYWAVGGTSAEDMKLAEEGKATISSHHSPLFKISPESVKVGTESTIYALLELLKTD